MTDVIWLPNVTLLDFYSIIIWNGYHLQWFGLLLVGRMWYSIAWAVCTQYKCVSIAQPNLFFWFLSIANWVGFLAFAIGVYCGCGCECKCPLCAWNAYVHAVVLWFILIVFFKSDINWYLVWSNSEWLWCLYYNKPFSNCLQFA